MDLEINIPDVETEIINKGAGYDRPTDAAEVTLLVIEDESKYFKDSEKINLTLGGASNEEQLALEHVIMKMTKDEILKIKLKEYIFTLKLLSFTKGLRMNDVTVEEKWRIANWHKDCGVEEFKKGKVSWAFKRFNTCLKYLVSLSQDISQSDHGNEPMNLNKLRTQIYSNISACHLKAGCYEFAERNASKALEYQKDNSKALFRRGTALLHLQEYERSLEDLKRVQAMEPQNAAVTQTLLQLKQARNVLDQKYAKAMSKMFQ